MKQLMAAIVFAALTAAAPLQAQRGMRGGMMMGNYDPKTEVTIEGIIEQVNRSSSTQMAGMGMGIHLVLKTADGETTEVHLGPAGFVEKTMTFEKGDKIQVAGSKVTMMGRPVVIAREISKDGQVLKLRDERGAPLWAGPHGS